MTRHVVECGDGEVTTKSSGRPPTALPRHRWSAGKEFQLRDDCPVIGGVRADDESADSRDSPMI